MASLTDASIPWPRRSLLHRSNAYNPDTRLFYLMALEKCSIYTKSDAVWSTGETYYGGVTREVPGERAQKFPGAIDLETVKIA